MMLFARSLHSVRKEFPSGPVCIYYCLETVTGEVLCESRDCGRCSFKSTPRQTKCPQPRQCCWLHPVHQTELAVCNLQQQYHSFEYLVELISQYASCIDQRPSAC